MNHTHDSNPLVEARRQLSRRALFRQGALGLGTAALGSLLGRDGLAASPAFTGGLPGVPHFAPKAKRAIYLFMAGAPCQHDLFDWKPKLRDRFNADLKTELYEDGTNVLQTRVTTMTSGQAEFPIAPSKFQFAQHGQAGSWISELLPYTARMADDIAIVRSMWTEAINHDPAITFIQTGDQIPGKPSVGSWLSYGLGSSNDDLPAYVVMTPYWTGRREAQAIYNRLWGAGFLPSEYQGVALRSAGDPVLYLSNPPGVDASGRRRVLDAVAALNGRRAEETGDPEIEARIAQYEMAFRMQTSVPDLTDLSDEPAHILEMYGPEVTKPGSFAQSCLLARRMAERGVLCTQIFHRGWDQHGDVAGALPRQCSDVDQPSWALVQDLKQRGLLEDTLVFWGGEFGRTVYCQGALSEENYGRDHHPGCFSVWLAGGGVQGGVNYGRTCDYGSNIVDADGQLSHRFVDGAVHVRDLNATVLHQLGIDHERLSVPFRGLDQRLTGVEEAHVVRGILS